MRPGTDGLDRVHAVAAQVMQSLERFRLAPIPENYELLYLYHEGSHPALAREINARLAAGELLDDATCRLLHARHVARVGLQRAVEEAGEQLTHLTSRLNAEVGDAETSLRQVAERIERLATRAAKAEQVDELRQIVGLAFGEARALVDSASQLEHRLRVTRAELAAVTEAFVAARREAETDPLTGLPNRRRLERALAHALERVRRGGAAPILLFADIDHFKQFNDRYGHLTGDYVLRAIAQLLRANVKDRDLVCRWGGEEFAVLLAPVSLQEAEQVAERLRRLVASRRIRERSTGRELGRVTLSIGLGEAAAHETPEAWVARVDRALYRAKARGRDRSELADPPAPVVSSTDLAFSPTDDAPAAASAVHPVRAMGAIA